jgi:hypothetical protein
MNLKIRIFVTIFLYCIKNESAIYAFILQYLPNLIIYEHHVFFAVT